MNPSEIIIKKLSKDKLHILTAISNVFVDTTKAYKIYKKK